MHRNRTWTLDPPEWRTQRNRLLPIEGGDGSTLNLDFTTGILDPRITFSRLSTATFVNSSGYVAYADTNLFANSQFSGTSQPTNWDKTTNWDGMVYSPGERRVTTDATGASKYLASTIAIQPGLTYSASVYVSEVSGQHYANTISPTGSAVVSKIYRNGVSVGSIYNTAEPGLITTVFSQPSGTTNSIRIGLGCTGSTIINGVCRFSQPRCVPGDVPQPTYFESPVATSYHAPRFDYSPRIIGTSLGLLFEGSSTNLNKYSETFTNAYWQSTASNTTAVDLVATSPTGVALTASTLTEIAGTTLSRHIHNASGQTFIPTASTPYTMSCFVKRSPTNPIRYVQLVFWTAGFGATAYMNYDLQDGVLGTGGAAITASSITPYRDGWYRITATATSIAVPAASGFQLGFSTTISAVRTETYTVTSPLKSIQLFGAQLEATSAATSYIPTGASTVTRAKDIATLANFSQLGWNTSGGSFIFNMDIDAESNTAGYPTFMGIYTGGPVRIFRSVLNNSSGSNPRIGSDAWTITPTQITNTLIPRPTKVPFKYGTSFTNSGNSLSSCVNGETVTTVTGTGTMTTATQLLMHQDPSVADFEYFSIHLKSIKYYPSALTNAQLQLFTSPNYVAPTLDIDFVPMTTGADLTAKGITFSRLTNATLINTAGVVQYADANEIRNSTMLTASNWTQGTSGGSPSVTINGNNTVTAASVAGIATWVQTLGLNAGLPISFSIEVTALTNTDIRVSDMFGAGFGFTGQTYYYTNTSGDTSAINSLTVVSNIGLYTITATTTGAGGNNIIFGTGCNSFNKTGSITFARPQLQYGTVVPRTNYFPNTSTAASYQGPRFNNAVLTSRANYIKQSNSFTTTPWVQKDGTHLATVTAAYEAAPPGFTGTATRITSSNAAAGITQALTLPAVAGKQIVISFYAKSNKTGIQACYVQASAGGIEGIEIPTTWTRVIAVNAAINSTLTEVTLYGLVGTLDFSIYGMQVEYVTTGSPLTAYIPTTTIGAISRTTKPRGILIEQATENLSLYSGVLYAGTWGNSGGITRSQDTLLPDPSGSNNACQITKASGFQYVVVNQAPIPTFTVPANSTRYLTGSVWLRVATSGQVPSIGIFDTGGTAFGTRYQARTDNDLVTISSGSGADIDITFGSVLDWVRVSVTRMFTNATASPISYSNLALYIYPNRQNENAATIYAWGTQMELASGATTYLPSVASAFVRSLESCYLSGSNFTSWYNTLNPAGTFYTEFDRPEASATSMGNPVPIGCGDYAPGKLIMVSCGESIIGTGMFAGIWTNVNFFSGTIIGAVTRKESNKIAFSFNENRMRSALNTTGLSNAITGAGSLNTKEVLYIGSDGVITSSIPAGSRDWLNSCVQRVVFYPTEFTPTQLTAIVS